MKVAHIFISYPNTNQTYNKKLIDRLVSSGLNVKVISFTKPLVKSNISINVLSHKSTNWFIYLYYFLKYNKAFKTFETSTKLGFKDAVKLFGRYSKMNLKQGDLIHLHHIQLFNFPLECYIKLYELKTVLSLRGSDTLIRPYRNTKEKDYFINALSKIDTIHTVSENLASTVIEYGIKKSKVYPIRRTIETTNSIKPNKNFNNIQITTIGRLHWTKGYLLSLKALKQFKDLGFSFTYVICGNINSEYYDQVIYWVNRLDLKSEVKFLGHLNTDELDVQFAKTNIYMQTSLSEGIPNTLIRALSNRIPCVVTNVGGVSEVFRNDIDGVMLDVNDEKGMCDALVKISNDDSFRSTVYNSKFHLPFDHSIEVNKYIEMYKTTLST